MEQIVGLGLISSQNNKTKSKGEKIFQANIKKRKTLLSSCLLLCLQGRTANSGERKNFKKNPGAAEKRGEPVEGIVWGDADLGGGVRPGGGIKDLNHVTTQPDGRL